MIDAAGQLGFLSGDIDSRFATVQAASDTSFVEQLRQSQQLASRQGTGAQGADEESLEQAREAARKLVASTFIIPMLEMSRDSVLQGGPFAPGMGERRFGPLLDQHIADAVVEGMDLGLIDTIVERFAGAVRSTSQAREQAERINQELQDAQ